MNQEVLLVALLVALLLAWAAEVFNMKKTKRLFTRAYDFGYALLK